MCDLKIYYFTPADILIPRVDRKCIMLACEGLQKNACNVQIISLNSKLRASELRAENPFALYGIEVPFELKTLNAFFMRQGKDGNIYTLLSVIERFLRYSSEAQKLVRKNRGKKIIFYSKNYSFNLFFLAFRLCNPRLRLIFEAHYPPKTLLHKYILGKMDMINCNTETLKNDLIQKVGLNESKIFSSHQGVNLDYIEKIRVPKEKARDLLKLPKDKPLIVYTGKVIPQSKEVKLILKTAHSFESEAEIIIVGGLKENVEYYLKYIRNKKIKNASIIGYVPPSHVYYYQFAADVLISFYEKGLELNRYRSPGKLFEYMASQRPIISADYPSIREVLRHKENCLLVEPENTEELAKSINWILKNKKDASKLAMQAYKDVHEYTWEKRGSKILSAIFSCYN